MSFDVHLWQGVRLQHAVVDVIKDDLVGLVTCYGYNPPGSAYVAFMPARTGVDGSAVAEAVVLVMGQIFKSEPIGKLFVEIPGYVENNKHLLSRLMTLEATFQAIAYWEDRLWDVAHWSVTRSDYARYLGEVARRSSFPTQSLLDEQTFRDRIGPFVSSDDQGIRLSELDSLEIVELEVMLESLCGMSADEVAERCQLGDLGELYDRHVAHAARR